MKTAIGDQRQGLASFLEISFIGLDQESHRIRDVFRASSQNLLGQKVSGRRDRHDNTRKNFKDFRSRDDLGLRSRRGEEQINRDSFLDIEIVLDGDGEPNGGQPAGGLLFELREDQIPSRPQGKDQLLRLAISFNRDRKIDVIGGSGLRTRRNGQASDQGPPGSQLVEVRNGPDKGLEEACHPRSSESVRRPPWRGTRLPMQPVHKEPMDLGISRLRIPAPEVLTHHRLGGLIEIEGDSHPSHHGGISAVLHEIILSRSGTVRMGPLPAQGQRAQLLTPAAATPAPPAAGRGCGSR
jgi:hypothetical protein